jgi:hypothetical protein
MASEPDTGGADTSRWLLAPPEPGQIHFHLDIGDTTPLTPEARAAIERLVAALNPEGDVAGYLMAKPCQPKMVACYVKETCRDYNGCSPYQCRISPCETHIFRPI